MQQIPEIKAKALLSMTLQNDNDYDIFLKARKANVIVMSKDYDFVKLIGVQIKLSLSG